MEQHKVKFEQHSMREKKTNTHTYTDFWNQREKVEICFQKEKIKTSCFENSSPKCAKTKTTIRGNSGSATKRRENMAYTMAELKKWRKLRDARNMKRYSRKWSEGNESSYRLAQSHNETKRLMRIGFVRTWLVSGSVVEEVIANGWFRALNRKMYDNHLVHSASLEVVIPGRTNPLRWFWRFRLYKVGHSLVPQKRI